jgi:hypothetical protein
MSALARLKGQEMSIRVLRNDQVVAELTAISSFNDEVKLEIKEDGFIGESVNRTDNILNSYGGDLEFQINKSTWYNFVRFVTDKAQRLSPEALATVFNLVTTENYSDGNVNIITYLDVSFGAFAKSAASRADFVKIKTSFACSERDAQINAL